MINEDYVSNIADNHGELYSIVLFSPTMFRLLPDNSLIKKSNKNRLSFIFRFVFGYYIYMIYSLENIPVGYCVIKKRQGVRQLFMSKYDVIIAPYFVDELYRGRGIATALLKYVKSHQVGKKAGMIFAAVMIDNVSSIKALSSAGFKEIGFLSRKYGIIQHVSQINTGVALFSAHIN